jgi:hypothetical protein
MKAQSTMRTTSKAMASTVSRCLVVRPVTLGPSPGFNLIGASQKPANENHYYMVTGRYVPII